jgi:hypothetical protein
MRVSEEFGTLCGAIARYRLRGDSESVQVSLQDLGVVGYYTDPVSHYPAIFET